MFVGVRHGNETAIHHEFAGRSNVHIEMLQSVIQRRRPHHAGVKVALKVLDEDVTAACLGVDVETWMMAPADQAIVRRVLFRRRLYDVEVERPGMRAPVVP